LCSSSDDFARLLQQRSRRQNLISEGNGCVRLNLTKIETRFTDIGCEMKLVLLTLSVGWTAVA